MKTRSVELSRISHYAVGAWKTDPTLRGPKAALEYIREEYYL